MKRETLATLSLIAFTMAFRLAAASPERDTAVIVNSGSTNSPGFRIVVERSGSAEFTATPPRHPGPQPEPASPVKATIPSGLANHLYADLKAASSLAALPASHCMKSVSFGSRMTIEFAGEESPDLSCPDSRNVAVKNLTRDCNEIVALFKNK